MRARCPSCGRFMRRSILDDGRTLDRCTCGHERTVKTRKITLPRSLHERLRRHRATLGPYHDPRTPSSYAEYLELLADAAGVPKLEESLRVTSGGSIIIERGIPRGNALACPRCGSITKRHGFGSTHKCPRCGIGVQDPELDT